MKICHALLVFAFPLASVHAAEGQTTKEFVCQVRDPVGKALWLDGNPVVRVTADDESEAKKKVKELAASLNQSGVTTIECRLL